MDFLPHSVVRNIDSYMGIKNMTIESDTNCSKDFVTSYVWINFNMAHHRVWGPAYIAVKYTDHQHTNDYIEKVVEWWRCGRLHRLENPAVMVYSLKSFTSFKILDLFIYDGFHLSYKGQLTEYNETSNNYEWIIREKQWWTQGRSQRGNILPVKINYCYPIWWYILCMGDIYNDIEITIQERYEDGRRRILKYENNVLIREEWY